MKDTKTKCSVTGTRRTDVVESPDVRGFSLDEMTILPDLCMYVCTQM